MDSTTLLSPWCRCPRCNERIPVHDAYVVDYFASKPVVCPSCHEHLDWWAVVRRAIEENFMFNEAFAFIGARTLLFDLPLRRGERTVFRFSDRGIPKDAKILYVNYTPYTPGGNGLFPLEWHGNVATRRFRFDETVLFPVAFGPEQSDKETTLHVMVSWVPHTPEDESWQNLVDAFEAYAAERYSSMIVPANVAVESALSRLMTTYLERFAGKKRAEDFLENAATYGHQLNVLLPMIMSLNSLSMLPDHVRGCLNRLRELRNELAHSGVLKESLGQRQSAEILCAALFGFHYVRHVSQDLLPSGT